MRPWNIQDDPPANPADDAATPRTGAQAGISPSAMRSPAQHLHRFLLELLAHEDPAARPPIGSGRAPFAAHSPRSHTTPHDGERPLSLNGRAAQLTLAEAALRTCLLNANDAFTNVFSDETACKNVKFPQNAVVIGPTQSGKSTVVNLLAGRVVTQVSPLAGFTVHPHGVWLASDDHPPPRPEWRNQWFSGREPVPPDALNRDKLDTFAFSFSPAPPAPATGSYVLWDTPDFDSLAAHAYRRGVLETVALADLLVVVLSKEKYADLAVWKLLELVAPLGRPLVVCLNKITPDARDAITTSLRGKLEQASEHWRDAPIVTLPYQPGAGVSLHPGLFSAARPLHEAVSAALRRLPPWEQKRRGVLTLIRCCWPQWIAPLEAELAAADAWRLRVDAAVQNAARQYRREFLDDPQRYDSFQRATAELLTLLEIPGVAPVLGQVRRVVTWPARQVWALGRAWFGSGASPQTAGQPSSEQLVLTSVAENAIVALRRDAARASDPALPAAATWQALGRRLDEQESLLHTSFQAAVAEHTRAFAAEIHTAANRLYEMLRERPALLHTLRAARATTDAASVAIAIKTGGAPLHDLLLAPALLAVTTLLTEGALGAYMERIAAELKERQREQVENGLLRTALAGPLAALAEGLRGPGLFGISRSALAAAEDALSACVKDWMTGGGNAELRGMASE